MNHASDDKPTAADYDRLRAGWGHSDWLHAHYRNAICEHLGIPQEKFGTFIQDLARIGLSIKIEQCGAHSDFLKITCALPKGHPDPIHMTYDQLEAERAKRGMQLDRRFEVGEKQVPRG